MLIYLGSELQQKLMTVFHYALKPTGFLMLGNAETIGSSSDLFASADKQASDLQQEGGRRAATSSSQIGHAARDCRSVEPRKPRVLDRDNALTVEHEANRLILDRYAPPGVIVDDELQRSCSSAARPARSSSPRPASRA